MDEKEDDKIDDEDLDVKQRKEEEEEEREREEEINEQLFISNSPPSTTISE
jgi:hypothetical protein